MSLNTKEVLKYINLARQYPKYYVALIDEQINSFVDQFNIQLNEEIIYETIEGKSAWEDAKTYLVNQEPIRPLLLHQGLSKAATDHARDIVKNNSSGHQGSDGSTFMERIYRYCKKGKGSMIELLGTTHLIPTKNSIELAMLNLIIDDGVNNRGHRKALFSNDYKYLGVDFIVSQDKIYSVLAMSQTNLEIIRQPPQSIATSTSHIKTMTELASNLKETASMGRNTRQNIIDEPEPITTTQRQPARMSKSQACPQNNTQVWTLKNVQNEQKVYSKKSLTSKPQIQPNQPLSVQPSVFKHVQNSVHSKSSISNSEKSHKEELLSPRNQKKGSSRQVSSKASIKESSLKYSQQSIRSDKKQNLNSKSSSFGLTSKVQEFNIKSSYNSPFLKSAASKSGFGSTTGSKKVVEKKETMRSWNQDEYLVKEITTIVKYDDGSIEDQVEKHSILKTTSNSYIKDATL